MAFAIALMIALAKVPSVGSGGLLGFQLLSQLSRNRRAAILESERRRSDKVGIDIDKSVITV